MSNRNVLVVTDADSLGDKFVSAARALPGSEVDRARDGREALTALAKQRPACLVMDVNLGAISARDVLACIDPKSTRVVVCGSTDEIPLIEALLGHGAHEFILKPFTIPQLTKKMDHLLAK